MSKVVLFILATVLALAMVVPAFASGADGAGRMYGRDHISVEARAGMLGPEMHPGMHRGFSGWVHM